MRLTPPKDLAADPDSSVSWQADLHLTPHPDTKATGRYTLVASLDYEDITVADLEDVIESVIAQSDDPVVASTVSQIGAGHFAILSGLRLQARDRNFVYGLVEGNEPVPPEVEFVLSDSDGGQMTVSPLNASDRAAYEASRSSASPSPRRRCGAEEL